MLTKIEDLRKGDLVLFPSNGKFIMIKLLQDPRVDPNPKGWYVANGETSYKKIKVSCRRNVAKKTYTWGGRSYTREEYSYECTPENHNYVKWIDPHRKNFWILERENN